MKIAIGCDHGGFNLKEALKAHLVGRGFEVLDMGTNSEESVDYPVYGRKTAEAVAGGQADLVPVRPPGGGRRGSCHEERRADGRKSG